jgi:hypothetical protein
MSLVGKDLPRFMHVRVRLARRVSNLPMSVLEKGAIGKEDAILVLRTRRIVRRDCLAGKFAATS